MTHPLARLAAEKMKSKEISAPARPVTAFQAPPAVCDGLLPGKYVVAMQAWSIEGVQAVDRLVFSAIHLGSQTFLDEERAERLIMESLATEPRALRITEADRDGAAVLAETVLLPYLAALEKDFRETETARHFDQVETQKALILEHKRREEAKAAEQIRDHRLSGSAKRQQLVYAVEGTLKKVLVRLDDKLRQIEEQEDDITLKDPVTIGLAVVEVEGPNR
jgi:hypothetical protein